MNGIAMQADPSPAGGLPGPPLALVRQASPAVDREATNALGAFLRARREQVTPQQAGIADGGVRRVPGLRREEVAMLAGISADYYLRLERGRDRRPSAQVLEALGRVLRLDEEHLAHLRALAAEAPRVRTVPRATEDVPAGVAQLLDVLTQPAFVEGRYFDILASNPLARALNPRLVPGRNPVRDLFLDADEAALHPDWDVATSCFASSLRQTVGGEIHDPGYRALIDELTRESPRFRELWARHEVRAQRGAFVRFAHPEVGALTLHRERLGLSGADGRMLVVYHAPVGSPDAEKLALLASAGLPSTRDAAPVR